MHPAKIEVRFARENDIFDVVYHAVKLALAQPGTDVYKRQGRCPLPAE